MNFLIKELFGPPMYRINRGGHITESVYHVFPHLYAYKYRYSPFYCIHEYKGGYSIPIGGGHYYNYLTNKIDNDFFG